MTRPRALIVDDEADIRELLELTLRRMDISTTAVESLRQAYEVARGGGFSLCLTDMRLPDGNGIDLIRYMHQHYPTVPVAMITAHGSMNAAIEALKAGAFDFVAKPLDLQVLRNLVNAALKLAGSAPAGGPTLVGESAAVREIRSTTAKLARSQAPVYVSGESGTGKELVARMIHDQGPRAERPFVPVNCGAIPEELMESEFFGHKRGSFTGAVSDKPGLFLAADGGTLMLDEVADLPLAMQVKLLRAIQEKAVRAVGAEREVPVDVRILSASHRDLEVLTESGQFRQDLYYRLNVINLHVPPLRERAEDIPLLARHLLDGLARQAGGPLAELSEDALAVLCAYPFPGNVRELENVLERAMTMSEGARIEVSDLGLSPAPAPVAANRAGAARVPDLGQGEDLDTVLENVEKETIVSALERERGNKTAAAKRLGISFGALRYRMQKLGLD
jgi:two-component system response regulator PilR (NtrC family)